MKWTSEQKPHNPRSQTQTPTDSRQQNKQKTQTPNQDQSTPNHSSSGTAGQLESTAVHLQEKQSAQERFRVGVVAKARLFRG
jgi:hypothetical protein